MALPSGPTPSPVNLIPAGVASNFSVRLLGPGPGLNLDFAVSIVQVPTQLSAARTTELDRTTREHAASRTKSWFLRMSDLLQKNFGRCSEPTGSSAECGEHIPVAGPNRS